MEVNLGRYKWISAACTIAPTIVFLVASLIAWYMILKRSEENIPVSAFVG